MFGSGVVDNLAALKGIDTTGYRDRANKPIFLVKEPVAGMVLDLYMWVDRSVPEMIPAIALPNTGEGAWVGLNRTVIATAMPAIAPPYVGLTWIATLTNPTRRVVLQSIGTDTVSDWMAQDTPYVNPNYGTPTFAPDFVGQTVIMGPSGGTLWGASGTTPSSWMRY